MRSMKDLELVSKESKPYKKVWRIKAKKFILVADGQIIEVIFGNKKKKRNG